MRMGDEAEQIASKFLQKLPIPLAGGNRIRCLLHKQPRITDFIPAVQTAWSHRSEDGFPFKVVDEHQLPKVAREYSSMVIAMMTARPQTIGYRVADSPAFLAAWILVHPGFPEWKYGADPAQSPTKDDVLENITLSRLTNSGTSSGRLYW